MTALMSFHDDLFDQIKQYQVYQDVPGIIVVRVVPKETCDDSAILNMKSAIEAKLPNTRVVMDKRDHIPLTARGKHIDMIQRLNIGY
jgi:hypothetical protein